MFNEINFRDSTFKDWRQPIYYEDYHVKEIWYNEHLFYPLGYIYSTRVTGRTNATMAFNFKTRDVYFTQAGDWNFFSFQASVDMTIKTCVKPAGFVPFLSSAHAGAAYSFDTGVATGGVLGMDWAWNKIFNPGNVSIIMDSNGNITHFSGKPQSVDTDHILLGLESAQAHPANSYWDDWDVTQGGWEFNTINNVQIIYNFNGGDIAAAAGSPLGVGSWGMSSPLFSTPSIDWMQYGKIGENYSEAFKKWSGQLIKFDKTHRFYTDDGLIFEYWLVHDWYPVIEGKSYWSVGKGGLSGVYLRQNGVTGIQVRIYDGLSEGKTGMGGVYFAIPFQNLVNCNYNYYGEPDSEIRAYNSWDEEKFKKLATEKNSTMLYLSPRSGQLPWQRSTITTDDEFYAKDGKRGSRAELNKITDNIYTANEVSILGTLRQQLIKTIKTQIGVPHVDEKDWIDQNWHSKVDEYWNCSDLVMWAYNVVLDTKYDKNCNYYWDKMLYEGQEDEDWEFVDNPLPGDLVWTLSGKDNIPSHVFMITGTNRGVGALNSGVAETTIDEQLVSEQNYYLRNKLLPVEDEQTLNNKLALENVEIQYKETNERTGGSTLYEQRKRANNIYAIQFVSGNNIPFPDTGKILFHIICDNAADHKIVNGTTYGNFIGNSYGSLYSNRIILEAPSKTYNENGEEQDVKDSVNATLFIDELPNTLELPATVGYPVKSFILKTGTAREIGENLNNIELYPYSNNETASLNIMRQEVIRIIKTQLNVPHLDPQYDYGDDWRSKVDEYWNCSDLVMWAIDSVLGTTYSKKNASIHFDKIYDGVPSEDWEFVSDLIPGDLIWSVSRTDAAPSHICMYIGNNLVIGAEDTGVHITPTQNQITMTEYYYVRNKRLPIN